MANAPTVLRFFVTVALTGVTPARSELEALTLSAAKTEAGSIRETLRALPTFEGIKLSSESMTVAGYNPGRAFDPSCDCYTDET